MIRRDWKQFGDKLGREFLAVCGLNAERLQLPVLHSAKTHFNKDHVFLLGSFPKGLAKLKKIKIQLENAQEEVGLTETIKKSKHKVRNLDVKIEKNRNRNRNTIYVAI